MGGKNMKKIILASFVVALLFFTAVGVGFTAGAAKVTNNQTNSQEMEEAGTGIIKGTITNQNGKPVAFVRIIAAGSPKDNATKLGITFTHLYFGGKGTYELIVPAGRYLFVRASRLPLYLGAWAGPVLVQEGQVTNLDLSITYIGPKSTPVIYPGGQTFVFGRLLNLLFN
jgi:hypothetical protein